MTSASARGVPAKGSGFVPLTVERRALRADDVAIAIDYCGVCHSDAHQVDDDWGNTVYPCVPGHEIIGRVTAVGPDVTAFAVGDRVGVGGVVDSCLECEACLAGDEQSCLRFPTTTYNGRDRITGEATYGGYADAIVVRERFVLRVPEALEPSLAGPLLCAGITVWTPLRRYAVGPGSVVAVVGLGGLGHLAVKLAVALGAQVTVLTTSEHKSDEARALGAHHILVSTDRAAMKAARGSFDLVIDTVPVSHDVNGYLMLLRRNATLVVVGALVPLAPVHGGLLSSQGLSIAGSLMGGVASTQELLDFCAAHGVVPDAELVGPDDLDAAFARMKAGDVTYRFVLDLVTQPLGPPADSTRAATPQDSAVLDAGAH